jgi:hypothetical protein
MYQKFSHNVIYIIFPGNIYNFITRSNKTLNLSFTRNIISTLFSDLMPIIYYCFLGFFENEFREEKKVLLIIAKIYLHSAG